jgi:hypothetical protein
MSTSSLSNPEPSLPVPQRKETMRYELLEGRSDEEPKAEKDRLESKLKGFAAVENVPAATRRGITLRSLRALGATVKGLLA